MLKFLHGKGKTVAAMADEGKKCCQGIRGKPGQTTVAPIKAWRGSPAEPLRPLTAPRDKTSRPLSAMPFFIRPPAVVPTNPWSIF